MNALALDFYRSRLLGERELPTLSEWVSAYDAAVAQRELLAQVPMLTDKQMRDRHGALGPLLKTAFYVNGPNGGGLWPEFQFAADGQAYPAVAEALKALRDSFPDRPAPVDEWKMLRWFISPQQALDGAIPQQLLPDVAQGPRLRAALAEFLGAQSSRP